MRNERMFQEFVELATTDSASGKESAIAGLIARKLEALGFTVMQDQAGDTFGGECGNLFAVLEGQTEGSIMFSSHMDRVPNGLGICPEEKDGVLYSDGTTILAADDVSGICAILEGIRQVKEEKSPLPRIELILTVGEEAGLYGAKAFDLLPVQSKFGYIFDSPGSVGRLVNGAPGMYTLKAVIKGRAAHAGNEPEKGINAAKIMCDMISTLRQGWLDEVTTSNFPILNTTGKAKNVVCDQASFEGEARSRDRERLEQYVEYFENHCRQVAAENHAELLIEKEKLFQPFLIPEDHPCMQVAKQAMASLGIPCSIEGGGGGMDGNIFNEKGLVCIGVATGYTKNHTKQEQLVLEDFFRSGDVAAELIRTYAVRCQ